MEKPFNIPQSIKNSQQLLETIELLSVVGAIGGAIASVVTSQVAFASIPLSLSVTLNLLNRRLLVDEVNQSHQAVIAQTATQFGTLNEQLAQLQQLTTNLGEDTTKLLNHSQSHATAIAQIEQEGTQAATQLKTINEKLVQLQQLTTTLGQDTSKLDDYTKLLGKEQAEIAKTAGYLKEISTFTQTIRTSSSYAAEAHYNRGLAYEQIGDKEGAIGDYNEAIRINPNYAPAYYARGVAHADLGDKKRAVKDLREAAKLFFEEGNIDKYQTARELTKKFHELNSHVKGDASEEIVLEGLFS